MLKITGLGKFQKRAQPQVSERPPDVRGRWRKWNQERESKSIVALSREKRKEATERGSALEKIKERLELGLSKSLVALSLVWKEMGTWLKKEFALGREGMYGGGNVKICTQIIM